MGLMVMRQNGELLQLTVEQRWESNRYTQSRALPAGYVFRGRLILALADRWSYSRMKERLQAIQCFSVLSVIICASFPGATT
jgi:hypothetical protein